MTRQPGSWCAAVLGQLRAEAALARETLARLGVQAAVGLERGAYRGGLGVLPGGSGAGLVAAVGGPVPGAWWRGLWLAVGWGAAG